MQKGIRSACLRVLRGSTAVDRNVIVLFEQSTQSGLQLNVASHRIACVNIDLLAQRMFFQPVGIYQ